MHRLLELAATLPGFLTYLAILLVLGGLAAWEIVRGRGGRAFGWVIALLLASLTFRFGDDTGHHVYRIAVLAEQLRSDYCLGSGTDFKGVREKVLEIDLSKYPDLTE